MSTQHDGTVHPAGNIANEPVKTYATGSHERATLQDELERQSSTQLEIPLVIGGKRIATKDRKLIAAPHNHNLELASLSQADSDVAQAAIGAAAEARHDWSRWSVKDRAEIFFKAADMLAGPWRQRLNAATMLGQSKTVHQAEIDAACELIDFLRFNAQYACEISAQQPNSSPGIRNQLDYRPLDGFVYAVSPFNFTAIGGNLSTAPILLGNTVVWKPATTASLSNYLFLCLLEEAGLPPGVINFVPGDAALISNAVLDSPDFAGLHFTGSTAVFDQFWLRTAQNLTRYRNYPRLVGETGGKDFVVAHASADVDELAVGLLRGAFEYQGQKCSAASRAYIPASLWPSTRTKLGDMLSGVRVGDVNDFSNFMGAVIDRKAYNRIKDYIDLACADAGSQVIFGGQVDDNHGYFIQPTVVEVKDPSHQLMNEEIFGPVLSIFVYEDSRWDEMLHLVDTTSPYALTGSVFARDRRALQMASDVLRNAAGNIYFNDKPTGAVVGQQPFGGARRSGTNDKAGSTLNLLRWTSPRTIKETYLPARDFRYPHMDQ